VTAELPALAAGQPAPAAAPGAWWLASRSRSRALYRARQKTRPMQASLLAGLWGYGQRSGKPSQPSVWTTEQCESCSFQWHQHVTHKCTPQARSSCQAETAQHCLANTTTWNRHFNGSTSLIASPPSPHATYLVPLTAHHSRIPSSNQLPTWEASRGQQTRKKPAQRSPAHSQPLIQRGVQVPLAALSLPQRLKPQVALRAPRRVARRVPRMPGGSLALQRSPGRVREGFD
jgi:hypothetical protein